MDDFQPLLFFH